jgi:hypothetical protein
MSDATAPQPWLQDRRIAHLLQVWRAARPRSKQLPGRDAIDPLALGADLLPYVALVEATDGGMRYRFRLVGSKLIEHAGLDLTGHYIADLNPNRIYATYINDLYAFARDERLPVYSETRYRAASNRIGLTRRLICPLAQADGTVGMFIAAQVFETDDRIGDAPTYTYAASFMPGVTLAVTD